jgi:hypothetical protein
MMLQRGSWLRCWTRRLGRAILKRSKVVSVELSKRRKDIYAAVAKW